MNPHTDTNGRNLTTADLAQAGTRRRAADSRATERTRNEEADTELEKLDALFTPDAASEFRSRWTSVQTRFVDDPRQAVRDGDELVAEVMKSLAGSFANERNRLEAQLTDGGEASTELLRVALRRYRSFFERLLTL